MRHVLIGLAALLVVTPAVAQTPQPYEIRRAATAASVISGEDCIDCDLFQVDLSYQELDGRNLSGSRLRQADLSLATLDNADLSKSNLSITNAFGARLENADLTSADLNRAVLVGAWLGGANLSMAKLDGTNLSGAYLSTAKGLEQEQLDAACGDDATELPDGLFLKPCKAAEPLIGG